MAACHLSSKCWFSAWIAVLLLSSLIYANEEPTEAKPTEPGKPSTENTLPSSTSSSNIVGQQSSQELTSTSSSFTYHSSSQDVSDILPSTLDSVISKCSATVCSNNLLFTSSLSPSQDVAISTTSIKYSSPGVDVSSFLTSSASNYVISTGIATSISQSIRPSATIASTHSVPNQSKVVNMSDTTVSQISSSSPLIRTSTPLLNNSTSTYAVPSSSLIYKPSSSVLIAENNTLINIVTTSVKSFSSSSIMTSSMSSSGSSLSTPITSTNSSNFMIITPSPSIVQTSTISSTPAMSPNMSSSSSVASTPLPGIPSSSAPTSTMMVVSLTTSELFVPSSSVLSTIAITSSLSSAQVTTSVPVVPTTPPKPPSSPPLNVTAYGRNSTSIMLSWQPPPTDTLNGELQKYEVKIEKVASDKCLSVTVTSKVNPSKSTPSSSFTSVSSATSTKLSSSSVSKQSSYSSTTSNYTRTPSVEPSSTTQTTAEPSSMTIVPTTPIEPTQPTVPMTPIEPTLPTELPKSPKTTSRLDRDLIDAGKNLSIMLGNLEVLTCYEIRVRVVTSLPGNWSSPVLAKTSQDPKPIAPPVDVRATAMSSSSLLVEWQPPPPQDRHGLIKHYIVEYYIKRDDIQYKSTAGNATRLTLTSLKPFTQYYVRVKAVNGAGAGPESEAVTNTTFEDEPSPPTNFTVRSVNVTSLFVSWGRPESLNGALVKYKLYYRQTVFNTSKDSLVYDGKDTKFVLTGLKKFTNYTLTLFAYNVRYGYRSTAVVATENTHPSVPSEPVDLQASNVTATSCFVTWKQPKHINGILSYYQVQYRPYASSSDPQNVTTGLSTSTTLQSMHAFTLYVIYVQAATGQGLGPPAILYVNTTEGVPSAIPYLQPYNVMSRSISIQWDAPKTPNGHIGYRLIYGLSDLSWIKTLEFTVTINKRVVTQLVPYTNYTFTISAYNIKSGQSGPSRSITEQTSPGIPSPPRNIRLTNRTAHSLAVTWDPPANPYGKISHYMIKVFAVENDRFLDTQRVDGQTFTVEPLKPYHEYTVYVSCTTNGGDSENSLRKTFRTLPSVPPTVQPIKPPSKDGITQDQIVIELEKASDSNGKISYYQVIVLELETNSNGNVIIPDENPDDYPPEKMFTYVGAKQQKPDLVPYIAAQFPASDFTKYRLFKVGDGNNFSIGARKRRDTTDQYFNGPLDPSTFYTMFQRAAINKDIYVSSEWTDPVATSEKAVASKKQSVPKTNVGLVAGVCVTLLLLIVIAIILFSFLWKKRRFAFGMMLDDEGDYSNRSFKLKKIRGHKRRRTSSRGLMGSTDSLDNLDDLSRRRQPIPVEDFANHVRRMHIDGDIGFSEEYELVQPDDKEFTWHHSLMPVNKHKNRYANIVAYDHSRVLLSPVENVQGSDYINANYIDGYSRSGAYIACQGPLPESFDDFWRMLWEQGTATIVMLTQLEERGRRKCDQYWPDRGTHMYGVIRVTASETSHMSYYTLRVFMISHKQDEEEPRQVKQYHFTSWPDHGVPTHPAPLLSLVRTVANANPSTAGPCLVHCSAGVGRTGTYIALDSSLQRIEKEQTLDIFDFVQQMRMKRNLMVQTESQYIFIHDALVEAVSCGVTEFEAKKCATRIRELREVDPDNGRTYMEKEFLRLLKDERHHSTFKAANMGVNSSKNRYLNILPYENTRVPLKMRPGEVGSDYVNASYIDGYCRQRVYIATQAPLPSTFEDYWRMIWEQGSCVIVMLTREEEAGKVKCHRYWPSDGTRIFGDVLVELTEEVSYTDYIMRQFNLTHTEEKDSRVVRQYQYTDWPDVGLPESGVGIIDLIGQVEKWQQQSNNSVITVHCSGGVGRTGVYCAISILIERVKAEGVIDVFQTVQSLRLQRPAMVQILEQYEFCYSTIQEYLESFDLYANFN